jgi:hypothetical protein
MCGKKARTRLEIYIEEGCLACRRSIELGGEMRRQFPEAEVVIISGPSGGEHRSMVLATPTFILNGEIISLGNPSHTQLEEALRTAMQGQKP